MGSPSIYPFDADGSSASVISDDGLLVLVAVAFSSDAILLVAVTGNNADHTAASIASAPSDDGVVSSVDLAVSATTRNAHKRSSAS